MQELIEMIRIATASDATHEQKAAGVQACRTIATALDTEPGKPLTLPGLAPMANTSRVSIDQVLDLAIARLSVIATEQDSKQTLAAQTPAALPKAAPKPRGLRVPIAPTGALKAVTRPARPGQRTR